MIWLLKFFVPPLVGAVFLAVANDIATFDPMFWGYATLLENIRITILLLVGSIITFYVYYLFAYLPFFLYLLVLEKTNRLSLVVVMISGFIYGLIPLVFERNTLLSVVIPLFIGISGAMCGACYYYLDKKFTNG